jgi:hypothetical protein
VEHDAVVLAFARQLLDLRHMLGRQVRAHLDDDAAVLEIDVERVFFRGIHENHRFYEDVAVLIVITADLEFPSPLDARS